MILTHECAYLVTVYKGQRKGLESEDVMMVSISIVMKKDLTGKETVKQNSRGGEGGKVLLSWGGSNIFWHKRSESKALKFSVLIVQCSLRQVTAEQRALQ